MQITADDRLDIIELPARYAEALDTLQPEQLRDVFTEDAVWEVVGGLRLEGMADIMEFMGRPDVHPGAHLMTNIYIAGVKDDPDGAGQVVHLRSRGIYPVGPSDRHNPSGVFYGRYDDDVVQTDTGWRIRHRRYEHGGGQPS
ncbi:MAG: nuclear transport factor 2 family protein [Acidimicrobiales bacterium]